MEDVTQQKISIMMEYVTGKIVKVLLAQKVPEAKRDPKVVLVPQVLQALQALQVLLVLPVHKALQAPMWLLSIASQVQIVLLLEMVVPSILV